MIFSGRKEKSLPSLGALAITCFREYGNSRGMEEFKDCPRARDCIFGRIERRLPRVLADIWQAHLQDPEADIDDLLHKYPDPWQTDWLLPCDANARYCFIKKSLNNDRGIFCAEGGSRTHTPVKGTTP